MMVAAPESVNLAANLGAFARIFTRDSAEALAAAFVDTRLQQVQLNLAALGLPTIPDSAELHEAGLPEIANAFHSRGLRIWGMSATYNIAHPDPIVRDAHNARAAEYIAQLGPVGAVAATLCSGTRDPDSMWADHPDNRSRSAWSDMRRSLDTLMPVAEAAGVLLAIEPEPGNIVFDAGAAIRLIQELGSDSDSIGIILDPANLLSQVDRPLHADVLRSAFDTLGEHTICVHAKDTVAWSETLDGRGVVNYDTVLELWAALPKTVPLIIQDASEEELPLIRDRLLDAALAT